MEQLNNKVISTSDETLFSAQVSGLYGFDSTADKWRRVAVNTNGELEMTAEITSAGLATEANQTNGDQKAKCMGGETDGTQQQILVSNLGVVQTLDSEVFGKTSQIANQTTLSNTNEATIIANQTNGTQIAKVGNTLGDGSGTATSLKTASDGSVHVVVENSDNVLIKGIQDGTATQKDAKTNSNGDLRSALIGNTAKDGTGTNYYVLVDTDGKLVTSGGGGGGGSTQYDMGDALGATPTGTVALGRVGGSGTAQALQVSTAGNQYVELVDFTKGQYNMTNSFPVVISSDQSTIDVQTLRDADSTAISTTPVLANATFTSPSIDMNGFSQLMIIGNTTNLTDQMDWYYSFDDATFFKGSQVLYDFLTGDFAEQPSAGVGARYIRVAQADTTASNFTVQFASSKR